MKKSKTNFLGSLITLFISVSIFLGIAFYILITNVQQLGPLMTTLSISEIVAFVGVIFSLYAHFNSRYKEQRLEYKEKEKEMNESIKKLREYANSQREKVAGFTAAFDIIINDLVSNIKERAEQNGDKEMIKMADKLQKAYDMEDGSEEEKELINSMIEILHKKENKL